MPSQLTLSLAVAIGISLAVWTLHTSYGVPIRACLVGYGALALAAIVGARGHFVLTRWQYFWLHPLEVVSTSGLHAGGAMALVAAAVWPVTRAIRVSPGVFADALVPAAGLSVAIGRLGCFLTGCCYGARCNYPWCIRFPIGSYPFAAHTGAELVPTTATKSLPIHPVQLYFALAALAIALLASHLRSRQHAPGRPAVLAVGLFFSSTLIIEAFRARTAMDVYVFGISQLAAVAILGTAVSGLLYAYMAVRQPIQSRSAYKQPSRRTRLGSAQ